MTKEEYKKKINKLFKDWQKARPEYKGAGKRFTEDGINNYDAYKKSKPRILFLLKENHANEEDYEPFWGITVDNKPSSRNIARWRHILIDLYANPDKKISVRMRLCLVPFILQALPALPFPNSI